MANTFDQFDSSPSNTFDQFDKPTTPPKRNYSAMEVPGNALMNLSGSAQNFAGGMWNAATHPRESLGALRDIVSGGVLGRLTPEMQAAVGKAMNNPMGVQRAIETANAAGGVLKSRYGGDSWPEVWDNWKRTGAEDPAGFGADLLTLIGGGANVVRGAATVAGATRVAQGAKKVADIANIPTLPMHAVEAPVRLAGKAAKYTYNNLMDTMSATVKRTADEPTAAQELRRHRETVPGVRSTAAEAASAANSPRLAALGEMSEGILPKEYYKKDRQNDAARLLHLRRGGGTRGDIARLERERSAIADPLYTAARSVVVDTMIDPVFKKLMKRPAIVNAFRQAKINAANAGTRVFERGGRLTGRGADHVKKALDKAITTAPTDTAIGASTAEDIRAAKAAFLDWYEAKNPTYGTARTEYAKMSKPVNQAELMTHLANELRPALKEANAELRSSKFVAASNTPLTKIKTKSGRSIEVGLEDLSADQLMRVNDVRADLAKQATTELQASYGRGGVPDPRKVASEVTGGFRVPNLINIYTSATNKILAIGEGIIDRKLAMKIATANLDPKIVAAILEKKAKRDKGLINKAGRVIGKASNVVSEGIHAPAVYNVLSPKQEQQRNELRGPK